jgi:putative nucleotidyltransferase with HDIG domain
MKPNREQAWELLNKYNKSESLITHAKAVESVMKYLAEYYTEDIDKWGLVGLIHDLDYEMYPDQHCTKAKEILESLNWDEEYIRAVISHGWGICSDVEPITKLEKTLFAIDELTGLIYACVLVRPNKLIEDLELKSVKKKWKIKTFAAGANRDLIIQGAERLDIAIDELINLTILGMKKYSKEIGI